MGISSQPHAVGVFHGKLQLGPADSSSRRALARAQSPCHAGFRPNVSV